MMSESLFPDDVPISWGDLGNESPAASEEGVALAAMFADPSHAEGVPAHSESGKQQAEAPLFDWPGVAPEPDELSVVPPQDATLPPPISSQGLWAEIGHLFQTPAFRQSTGVAEAPTPSTSSDHLRDALSQALLANDEHAIQTLVQQIQQTYDDAQSIAIFLAALQHWCR
jgi:hypothetical protein